MEDVAIGDVLILSSSESIVRKSFDRIGNKWNDEMITMLGKSYSVLEVLKNGVVSIESPDGSQDGKWYFSGSAFINVVLAGK